MLELLIPDCCYGCNSYSRKVFCSECIEAIDFLKVENICKSCGTPYTRLDDYPEGEAECIRCLRREFSFHKCRSIAKHSGLIKDLLHKFKYRKKIILGKVLSGIISDYFPEDFDYFEIVVPVPLNIHKLRKREYNQSAIFSKIISNKLIKMHDPFVLKRDKREKRAQYEVQNLKERKKNVKGVFNVTNKKSILGRSILLVDDVFTTGSTLNECSKILIDSGAAKVQCLTLTRASI